MPPEEALQLIAYIYKECPKLLFRGLMTMGKLHDVEGFQLMQKMKEQVIEQFNTDRESFILSMGTSNDFEDAIIEGSNEVRIGTTIFGGRDYSKKNE